MKNCPSCQRVYADDTLSYCLDDGTALLSVAGLDPDRTLALYQAEGGREAPPTEFLDPARAPTLPSLKPSAAAGQETLSAVYEPQRSAPPTPRKRSTQSVVAITVVVTVLLGLSGLGAWLLLKDKKSPEVGETPKGETTPVPTITPRFTPSSTPPNSGYIQGSMVYPSDAIPGVMVVCAENVETRDTSCSQSRKDWETGVRYNLKISPGRYYVYGKLLPGDDSVGGMQGIRAYYTDYVKCGMGENCRSHERIILEVEADETLTGISIGDWWANL